MEADWKRVFTTKHLWEIADRIEELQRTHLGCSIHTSMNRGEYSIFVIDSGMLTPSEPREEHSCSTMR